MDNFREQHRQMQESVKQSDPLVHAQTVISEPHRMVHDGFAFHATGRVASLGNGASLDILLAVPALTFPHMRAMLFSLADSPCDILTYEGTTTTGQGTPVTALNRNRNSTITPGMVVTTGPTISAVGTQVHDRFVPDAGGQGSNDVGIITPNLGEEWILSDDEQYLIRLTNNSGGAIALTWEMLWYEVGYED